MHLIQITVDGFKSYAKRTDITGFDREFNAITGGNGHGKSNVLDAICFVLGISNLSQVRAPESEALRGTDRLCTVQRTAARFGSLDGGLSLCPVAFAGVGECVRASNLNELIYKHGQAGVTKATVTLVFDNSDPAASPLGYE
eukprot:1413477-Prymnesium_polylepis.1